MAGLLKSLMFGGLAGAAYDKFRPTPLATPQIPDAFRSLLSSLPQPVANDPVLAGRRRQTLLADQAAQSGPRSTVLTGPSGLQQAAPTQRQTLLGGG